MSPKETIQRLPQLTYLQLVSNASSGKHSSSFPDPRSILFWKPAVSYHSLREVYLLFQKEFNVFQKSILKNGAFVLRVTTDPTFHF